MDFDNIFVCVIVMVLGFFGLLTIRAQLYEIEEKNKIIAKYEKRERKD